jgi:hypothetical protein
MLRIVLPGIAVAYICPVATVDALSVDVGISVEVIVGVDVYGIVPAPAAVVTPAAAPHRAHSDSNAE